MCVSVFVFVCESHAQWEQNDILNSCVGDGGGGKNKFNCG